jgi:hypothetical protein
MQIDQLQNMQTVSYFNVPMGQLDLPSADEILQQIRNRRKERKGDISNDFSKDELDRSYTDHSNEKKRKALSKINKDKPQK